MLDGNSVTDSKKLFKLHATTNTASLTEQLSGAGVIIDIKVDMKS